MKRSFQRMAGFLIDTDDDAERKRTTYFPASFFGESPQLDAAARDRVLEEIANGAPVGEIGELKSAPNLLDVFLRGLAAGNSSVPIHAARLFGEDPRVREALRHAVVREPLGALPNFVQALAMGGGADDVAVLRQRLNEGLSIRSAFAFASFANPVAHTILCIAEALLKLEPDAVDVAAILVRFFQHPCAFDRRAAVRIAVEILEHGRTSEAMARIKAGVEGLADADDPAVFLLAAPLLARPTEGVVLRRCEDLLYHESDLVRADALNALREIPPPYAAEALAALARWVPTAAPLGLALSAAATVGPLLPIATASEVARRALAAASPALRFQALGVLRGLEVHARRRLLLEALADEPEAALRRKFEELLEESRATIAQATPRFLDDDEPDPRLRFMRHGRLLLDPPEADTGAVVHAAELAELLSGDERARLHAQLASTERAQQEEAIAALGPDRAPETLEALLHALDQGCPAAAAPLLGFLDDPRVRPALIAALRRAPPADIEPLARAVGAAGGDGAIEALRPRLSDAAAAFEAEADPAAADAALGTLLAVAQGLLRLDPDAGDAAEGLALALDRAASPSRWLVVDTIVQVLRPDLATSATRSLERALAPLLDAEDLDSFLAAAPLLARDHGDAVLRRCAAALLDPGGASVREAALALARIPFPFAARALSTVARWVRRGEGPLGELLWAAGLVIELLDPESTVELLRRGLAAAAPSLRLDAMRTIQRLSPTAEHLALLATAADGEPDALLRREMRRVAAGVE